MADFTFTPEQEAGICKIVNWYDTYQHGVSQQVMRMIGEAGSGKTSIMKEIAARTKRRVRFGAFAGKAAMVLSNKGCLGAETLHMMLYEPRGGSMKRYKDELAILESLTDPAARKKQEALLESMRESMSSPGFNKRPTSEFHIMTGFSIDEVSMVDKFIGGDLMAHNFPILAVGDPFQLPPAMGTGFFFPKGFTPDVHLTRVHRQAGDSPVLKFAHHVRQGKTLPYGRMGESKVVKSLTLDEYIAHDQILCGTNKNRIKLNIAIRKKLGRKKWLEPGEKMICLVNNYDVGMMNGSQWEVMHCAPVERKGQTFYKATLKSLDEEDNIVTTLVHLNPLMEGTGKENKHWTPMLSGIKEAVVMTYGYAITVHKSQGSQWNSVAVFDDWNGTSYAEWLYTAITRAAKQVTVVKP